MNAVIRSGVGSARALAGLLAVAGVAHFVAPDTFASLVLSDGGHLSHGMKINFSGRYFKPVHYPLIYDLGHERFEQIDYDAVRSVCLEHKPKMILCGYSAYPRVIDFARFRAIAASIVRSVTS